VLAGLRVVAELVQLLVALGAQPCGGQQVCRPLQQPVPEAQLALDAKAGVVGSIHQDLLACALAGQGCCGYRREEGSRVAARAAAEHRALLAVLHAGYELPGVGHVLLAGDGSEQPRVGLGFSATSCAATVLVLHSSLRLALQSRERREVQLLARSLPLLLCPSVCAAGCCSSLLRAPSTCAGAGCVSSRVGGSAIRY
jgi:hypothetical protein